MTTRGRGSVRIGPISLFALVIILCLAVMAVLSVTTAQATYAAAERQASFTADTYANERAGQEFAADIDAAGGCRAGRIDGQGGIHCRQRACARRRAADTRGRHLQRGVVEGYDAVDGERRRRDAVVGRCADTIGAMR